MKQIANMIAAVSMLFLFSPSLRAQSVSLSEPERLADLLTKEKASGNLNDGLIVAYLDSLGFKKVDDKSEKDTQSFVMQVNRGDANESILIKLSLGVRISTSGIKVRYLRITCDDHPLISWAINKLIKFGIFQTEGEGAYMDLKGKGLYGGTSPNSIMLCYQIEETK